MELKINIEYNEILNLIQQMPEKDIRMLADVLNSQGFSKPKSADSIRNIILDAPVWSDEDFNNYQLAHESLNKSRIA